MIDQHAFDFDEPLTFALDVFTDATSSKVVSVLYHLVGAVTYSGDSYQRAIKIGGKWWIQDDNTAQREYPTLPSWFACNLSHVWLVRVDLHRDLHIDIGASANLSPTVGMEDAMAEVRAYLQTRCLTYTVSPW